MYLKQEKKKYISVLLVLFLIFQLFSILFIVDDFDFHTYEPTSLLTSGTFHVDYAFGFRSGRKNPYHPSSPEFNNNTIKNILFADIFLNKSILCMILADNRKEIKQSIPHYFHGSKYKDSSLLI